MWFRSILVAKRAIEDQAREGPALGNSLLYHPTYALYKNIKLLALAIFSKGWPKCVKFEVYLYL